MELKEKRMKVYDDHARGGYTWKKRNWFYHKNLHSLISFLVPAGKKVLEVGCGRGELLHVLRPKAGVGIDFSSETIATAREMFPELEFYEMDAEDLALSETFDYVIMSDIIGELSDVYHAFTELHKVTDFHSRVVVTYFNYLWAPFLRFAEIIGFKMPQPLQNWLSLTDISNFLSLAGFEVIKKGQQFLLPVHIPFLSRFVNKYFAFVPVLRKLCLTQYIVARRKPEKALLKPEEYSCTVLVPTRNEKGNIEPAVNRIPAMGKHTEILFVDGSSTDGTIEEIERMIEKWKGKKDIKLLHQVEKSTIPDEEHTSGKMLKLGKGDAVRKGFDAASGDILMICDADLTVPPEDLPKFFHLTAERAGELLMGTRLVYPMEKQAMRFLNILGNKFFSLLFSWLLEQPIKDTLCGTKVLRKEDYQSIKSGRNYFGDFDPFGDFDLIFGAAKLNMKLAELPIRYRQRTYGDIKIERFKHGLILLKMSFIAFKKFKLIDFTVID